MSRYVALLRAINVGRGRSVKMESLRQLFESLGFSKVATFIASGNVVFEATTKNVKLLEKKIEKRLRQALGYEVGVFLRTDAELAKIATYKPFLQSRIGAAAEFNIVFLSNTIDEKFKQKVMALKTDTDDFRVHGREIYWLRRKKPSGSTFSTVPFEKTLDRPVTIRSASTVRQLAVNYSFPKS
jgi:uncharacterized protein (DUF1697 family)